MIEGIWIGINTAFSGYNIFMVMVGCFAGTIPAIKASRLNPVDSLRFTK